MESSECIYGILKKRWPILTSLRNHLPNAMEIILTCCILHNILIKWGLEEDEDEDEEDENVEGNDDDNDENEDEEDNDVEVIDDDLDNATIRARGAVVRENMKDNMPPPTPAELGRIRANIN